MHIGFYSFTKQLNKNRIFFNNNLPIGDNLMYPFVLLAKRLEEQGHKISTLDMDDIKKFDAVIFLDFPTFKNKDFARLVKNKSENLYLITLESPIIKPDSYDVNNHKYFKKIFTWADKLVDEKKYLKINYSFKIPEKLDFDISKKNKLCTVISSNKCSKFSGELYSERVRAIRWFEENHPDDFDLWGFGWDRRYFYGNFLGFNMLRLNRLKFLAKILGQYYPSWKGPVKSKNETYKNYKFAICYENVEGFNGYITEKIFDCFFAGCVPIYLGASNITHHIPKDTFIDKKDFSNYEELYKYIKNIPDEKYLGYLNAIKNFLKSEKSQPFSAEYFADAIIKNIIS